MNLNFVFPMFAMVVLTTIVLVVMFRTRVRSVKSGKIDIKYFRTYIETANVPEDVAKTQRHFANLFEVPVLFYVGCLVAMIVPVQGLVAFIFAWAFVILRYVHTYIHIGSNRLSHRMRAYGLSWIALLGLWITIVVDVLGKLT